MGKLRYVTCVLAGIAFAAACGEQQQPTPEEAQPADTIAPGPIDQPVVPGADQPGPQTPNP